MTATQERERERAAQMEARLFYDYTASEIIRLISWGPKETIVCFLSLKGSFS